MYDAVEWMRFLSAAMSDARIVDWADLCRKTGIRQANVNKWDGGSQPNNDSIRRLSRVLGVSIRDLLIAAGHFSSHELSGSEDALSIILESTLLDETTKIRLIREYRRQDQEREKRTRDFILDVLANVPRQDPETSGHQ